MLKLLEAYGVDDQYVYELEVIDSNSSETKFIYLSRNIHFYLKDRIEDLGSLQAIALFPETMLESMKYYHYWDPVIIGWDNPTDSNYIKTIVEFVKNEFMWFYELNQ